MRFSTAAEALDAAILGGPLAGLFVNRLSLEQQAEVCEALQRHVERVGKPGPDGWAVPAQVTIAVGRVPAEHEPGPGQ
jgi:hypothetical protein